MPWVTPGTPLGNTGSRTPGSFFLVSKIWNVSSESQPASMPPSGNRRSVNTTPLATRIVPSSALAGLGREAHQHVDALAHCRRCLQVAANEVGPLAHGRHIAGLPRREREQLARAVAERRAGAR